MRFKLDECCGKIVDIILEPYERLGDIKTITFPVVIFDDEGLARRVLVTDLTYCSIIREMELTEIYFEDGMRMVSGFKGVNVQNIHFPGTVDYINTNAFSENASLRKIFFEDGSRWLTIQEGAFEDTGVHEVEFPENIHTIAENAFANCYFLNHISFRGEKSRLQRINNSAFAHASIIELTIPPTEAATITIEEGAFKYCDKLTTVNFPYTNIKKISKKCFMSCYQLTTVNFPTSLKDIGPMAFSNCNLKTLDLSKTKVKRIGPFAFYLCNVEKAYLPVSITTIETSAFELCENLSEINFPAKLKKINTSAFNGTKITNLDFSACRDSLVINNAFSDKPDGYTIKASPYILFNDEVLNKYTENLFC